MFKIVSFIASLLFTFTAHAQDPAVSALSFQTWKEQQVLEAQNQTLRVSARISQLKSAKGSLAGAKTVNLPNAKVKKTESDSVAAAERDLRRAQESLQIASALTLEDYVSVYLPTLQGEPEALQALAQKMSKEELAEIFKLLVSKGHSFTDAKRNGALAGDPLTVPPQTKAQ